MNRAETFNSLNGKKTARKWFVPRLVPQLVHVSSLSHMLKQRNPARLSEGKQSVRGGKKGKPGKRGRKALS